MGIIRDPDRISEGPCQYKYSDNAQCVYNGKLIDNMCGAHFLITGNRKYNKESKQRSYQKEKDA